MEGGDGFTGVIGAHQAFADEDAVGAGFEDLAGVGRGFDAAFADEDQAVRDFFAETCGGAKIDHEAFEVPVIDADDARVGFQSAFELSFVVDFD